jgi:hypothetical protein
MARRFTSFPAKLRILDRRYPNVAVGVTIAVHDAATARSADMNDLARGQRCVGTMGADPFRSESQGPLMADSVEKVFLCEERKFSRPLMRFARGNVRDHIVSYKNDHRPSYQP